MHDIQEECMQRLHDAAMSLALQSADSSRMAAQMEHRLKERALELSALVKDLMTLFKRSRALRAGAEELLKSLD